MRIISDFHDYYDCILHSVTHDPKDPVIYLRKTSTEYLTESLFPINIRSGQLPWIYYKSSYSSDSPRINRHTIGFCGKVYPLLEIDGLYGVNNAKYSYHYNLEDFSSFVEKFYSKAQIRSYYADKYERKKHGDWRSSYHKKTKWPYEYRYQAIKQFFDGFQEVYGKTPYTNTDIFTHPIFLLNESGSKHELTWNPRLKDLTFYRVIDTQSAYQELSMWMGSLAAPQEVIPKISDVIMAEAKGFDKYSFRKDPRRDKNPGKSPGKN